MPRRDRRRQRTGRRLAKCAALALVGLFAVLCAYMLVEARTVQLVRDEVRLRDLPRAFDGVKLLFVSDLHVDALNQPERAYAQMRKLQELEPDVLLLGGDYTSFGWGNRLRIMMRPGDEKRLKLRETALRDRFFGMMQAFEAPLGKFAVAGNHDNWTDGLKESLALGEITLLRNRVGAIERDGSRLVLVGLDDWSTGTRGVGRLAEQVASGDCVIVLSHNPDAMPVIGERVAKDGAAWADLVLSGHTHGGQVRVFGRTILLPSIYGDRYRSGWIREGDTQLLVSNGVGTTGLPVRLNAPAQAHLITLHCAD